jgi:hypothetical protein
MKKNGKDIPCKKCGTEFYVSKSRIGKKKYCARECAKADNWGFVPRDRDCKICTKSFPIKTQLRLGDRTCSQECWYENNKRISAKHSKKKKEVTCKDCNVKILRQAHHKSTNRCDDCIYKKYSEDRTGKGNPNYKDGKASWDKYGKRSAYTVKHFKACKKYRAWFVDKNDYPQCEVCRRTDKKTHVHHIYYASRYPRHEQLHNFKNLIMVCVQCHNDFHAGKLPHIFAKIEEERGLKELFS